MNANISVILSSSLVVWGIFVHVYLSSTLVSLSSRPDTPPWSLAVLKAARMPARRRSPATCVGPENEADWPNMIWPVKASPGPSSARAQSKMGMKLPM